MINLDGVAEMNRFQRNQSLFAAFVAMLDEVVVAVVILLGLPSFGIYLDPWIVIIILGTLIVLSIPLYKAITRAYGRQVSHGFEAVIGMEATVIEALNPIGHVRLGGEIWKAQSLEGYVDVGKTVVVMETKGLMVKVKTVDSP